MVSQRASFSEEIRKCVEGTSTRGVSRILKAERAGLRVVWMLAVLLSLLLLLLHTFYLFHGYMLRDFTTAEKEQPYFSETDHQVRNVYLLYNYS